MPKTRGTQVILRATTQDDGYVELAMSMCREEVARTIAGNISPKTIYFFATIETGIK